MSILQNKSMWNANFANTSTKSSITERLWNVPAVSSSNYANNEALCIAPPKSSENAIHLISGAVPGVVPGVVTDVVPGIRPPAPSNNMASVGNLNIKQTSQQQQQQQQQLQLQPQHFPNGSALNQLWNQAALLQQQQLHQPLGFANGIGNIEQSAGQIQSSSNNIKITRKKQTQMASTVPNESEPPHSHEEIERRQRNRVFSKRSREKKKNQHLLLEQTLKDLQTENKKLRHLVKTHIPDKAQAIIKKCCSNHPLHEAAMKSPACQQKDLIPSDFTLIENLVKGRQSFVITDPAQADNPIVYASEAFLELTGYTKEQTLGRNCRFLQGVGTEQSAVAKVRRDIEQGKDTSVNLLNYKADGTPFWNQFFIAALRDKNKNIINYVGVQCEIKEPPNDEGLTESADVSITLIKKESTGKIRGPANIKEKISEAAQTNLNLHTSKDGFLPNGVTSSVPATKKVFPKYQNGSLEQAHDISSFDRTVSFTEKGENQSAEATGMNEVRVDWSTLAGVLEEDFQDGIIEMDDLQWGDMITEATSETNTSVSRSDQLEEELYQEEIDNTGEIMLRSFLSCPKNWVTKTCRSELVDSLLAAQGDVTNERFLKALDILSTIYASTNRQKQKADASISTFLNGSWVSLSRPAYGGCLGKNLSGDFMYTLGKMSFGMFKPENLQCSVQHTLNNIKLVCGMDEAPTAAPWSLRRELALFDPNHPNQDKIEAKASLRSYDIEIAITIEPDLVENDEASEETAPRPSSRLKAVQLVRGYILPDPDVQNRLTVWFTGGKLSPVNPASSPGKSGKKYGDFEEWKKIFGDSHKKTSWSESFKNMGAKLLLGAELPQGMDGDGSFSYTLHRPYGGHGKGYIEVLYLDEDLYVTRGNYGTIHVAVRSDLFVAPQATKVDPVCSDEKLNRSDTPTEYSMEEKNTKQDSKRGKDLRLNGSEIEKEVLASGSNPTTLAESRSQHTEDFRATAAQSKQTRKRKAVEEESQSEFLDSNIEVLRRPMWKEDLRRDLESRGANVVAVDLSEILASYGFSVTPTTKRLKR